MVLLMKWAVIAATSILLEGCVTLPPMLQRWADLDISTAHLHRVDADTHEAFLFSQDGLVEVHASRDNAPRACWRVRGAWLEVDTANDGSFRTRWRALSTVDGRIVAVSPAGKRSVWRKDRVIVVIKPLPQRPGLWMP